MLLTLGPIPGLKKNPGSDQDGIVETPKSYNLAQHHPNPFNPSTTIEYSLPEPGNVSLQVYDLLGARVAALASGPQNPGSYATVWDAQRFGSRVYFVRPTVKTGPGSTSYSKTNKILLLK